MKKYYIAIFVLICILALPAVMKADNENTSGSVRDKLRANVQVKVQNAENNQEMRNRILENRKMASTTSTTSPFMRGGESRDNEVRPNLHASTTFMASTSMRMHDREDNNNEQGDKENRGRLMQLQMFKIRKEFAGKQLEVALNNLKQIRNRINDRINKEQQSGRDMTQPKALLVIADGKITLAGNAINDLTNFRINASSTTATSTATTTIDLPHLRDLMNKTKDAVKDAQKSLVAVVVSIAHNSGFKFENDDHHATTTPITSTSTNSTASSTNATSTATTTTP